MVGQERTKLAHKHIGAVKDRYMKFVICMTLSKTKAMAATNMLPLFISRSA